MTFKTRFIWIYFIFQEDEKFLTELFNQLTDEDTDENRRKELVLFLKEFFSFSTTLQPQARESFFKTLNSLGVLQAMEVTLASENKVKRLLWRFFISCCCHLIKARLFLVWHLKYLSRTCAVTNNPNRKFITLVHRLKSPKLVWHEFTTVASSYL